MNPEFFDIFGLIGFAILLITGWTIRKRERFASFVIMIISIAGLIIDGYIVIKSYLLG